MAPRDSDAMAELARQLGVARDLDSLWSRVVDASVVQIEGAERAGITAISRRKVSTPVATDDVVRVIDRQQYATGQGPCLSAAFQHEPTVRVDDLRADDRWPTFSAAVQPLGVRAMLSFKLYTDPDRADHETVTIGALNVYASVPNAFTDESVHTGILLAAHAAVAAAANTVSSNLRIALQSRDVIGQAKGILMERYRITATEAFDLLIAASQRTHRKLHDVATLLTDTGELVVE